MKTVASRQTRRHALSSTGSATAMTDEAVQQEKRLYPQQWEGVISASLDENSAELFLSTFAAMIDPQFLPYKSVWFIGMHEAPLPGYISSRADDLENICR